jgi:RNA-binding protein 26
MENGRPEPAVVSQLFTTCLTNCPARGCGGRPGAFGGEVQRFRLEQRDRTLVVKKTPEDRLSPDAVHGWFERFGTVTNVVVDATSAKALVSLSTHKEAHAAWKTEGAIFGNRFFRVFWHGGPRSLRGSALSASRGLCADCRRLHSRVTHHALTPLAHTLSGPPAKNTAHDEERRTIDYEWFW